MGPILAVMIEILRKNGDIYISMYYSRLYMEIFLKLLMFRKNIYL